ncbi:PilW family protein [Thermus tenuipuniceus]|uniref:PilW family protein n=1 Tax=Thermus tenuipuniceus TaxID=2078690 RepID=UPI0013E3F152|nr:prepilin-type N-terminal cleavage/methylation domain-containing protein [Thermus tenuipuniceus]
MRKSGFTLIELLVALGIGALLLGLLLSTTLANRRLYVLDQSRTATNQNLRAALDLLVADVRQAGERLPADFPAVVVKQGAGGAPDQLILRRNLLDEVLLLCDQNGINGNQDNIPVAVRPQDLNQLPEAYRSICQFRDGDGNNMDDRIDRWRAFRCAQDGNPVCATGTNHGDKVRAYLYDPRTGQGEWFVYDAEDQSGVKIHKGNAERWQNAYPLGSRVYLLEERRYFVAGAQLKLAENGEADTAAKGVVTGVRDFQVRAQAGGAWLSGDFPQTGQSWRALQGLELRLVVRVGQMERELVTKAFPRNVLSQ